MENDSVSLFSRSSISFLSFFLLLLYFHFSFHLFVWRKLGSPSFLLVIWPLCLRTLVRAKKFEKSRRVGAHTHIQKIFLFYFFKEAKTFFWSQPVLFALRRRESRSDFAPSPLPTQPMCPFHLFPFLSLIPWPKKSL